MPPGTNIRVGLTLSNQFSQPLVKATANVKVFGQAAQASFGKASRSAGGFFRTISNLNRLLFNLKVGLVGLGTGFAANRLITFAGDLESVRKAFEKVTESKGLNPTSTINRLREAARGLASDFDLFKFANGALLQGSAKTEDQLSALVTVAVKTAQALGRSLPDALTRLQLALATGRIARLDELALIIDATEAYEEYAAQIGKSALELTELEKKQAFANKVFRTAKDVLKSLPEDVTGLATSYGGFVAALKNLGGQFLLGFGPTLARGFSALTKTLNDSGDAILGFFADIFEAIDRFFPRLTELATAAASSISTILAPLAKILEFVESENLKKQESTTLLRYNKLSQTLTSAGVGSDRPFSYRTDPITALGTSLTGLNRSEFERAYTEGKEAYKKLLQERLSSYKGDRTEIIAAARAVDEAEAERDRILGNIAVLRGGGRGGSGALAGGVAPGVGTSIAEGLRGEVERRQRERFAGELARGKKEAAGKYNQGGVDDVGSLVDDFSAASKKAEGAVQGIVTALEALRQKAEDTFTLLFEATLELGNSISTNLAGALAQAALRADTLRVTFRNLGKSILEDITAIGTKLASEKLVGAILGALGSILPEAAAASRQAVGVQLTPAQASAQAAGDQQFDFGFDPSLNVNARGGIATRPSIFGEAGPEAAVPLVGGRAIPVDLAGSTGNTYVGPIYNVQTIDAVTFDQYFRAGAVRNKKALGALNYRSLQQRGKG